LSKKKGTTSVTPAFVTVLFPHALNVAAAAAFSGVPSLGALKCSENLAIVAISLWKWFSKSAWKPRMMRNSSSPEKSEGLFSVVRYFSNSARPARNDSVCG
jgi:hypothetical protein